MRIYLHFILEMATRTRPPWRMPQALLIGGPPEFRGAREVTESGRVGSRLRLWVVEPSEKPLPFTHAYTGLPGVAVFYEPCPSVEGVYVAEGYEPVAEDEEVARAWLSGL